MKKYLFAYADLATALLLFTCRHYRAENRRLVENQTALAADVAHYRTRLGAGAASVQAHRLRCGEFETLRAADAEQIRRLGIRLRRLEAAAKAEGLDKILAAAGFELRQPGCSACLAMNADKIPAGKYSVSTSNRNFEGRQGPGARTMLSGVAVAAAAAVTGVISDPREVFDM